MRSPYVKPATRVPIRATTFKTHGDTEWVGIREGAVTFCAFAAVVAARLLALSAARIDGLITFKQHSDVPIEMKGNTPSRTGHKWIQTVKLPEPVGAHGLV